MRVPLNPNGTFTFLPGRLILGQTEEDVVIPSTETWEMGDYLVDSNTGEILPLTAHFTAPLLKPNSRGPQTYEMQNRSESPMTILPSDLRCIVFVVSHASVATREPGKFSVQKKGEMRLGSPYSPEEKARILKALQENRGQD